MPTLAQLFNEGYQIGESTGRKSRARAAARAKYGPMVDDPELFSALQDIELRRSQDRRAERDQDRADRTEQRYDRAEQRAQASHDFTMGSETQDRRQKAVLGMVTGLRQVRDAGGDLGKAFDNMRDTLLATGVSEDDIPELRTQLLEDPGLLDAYYKSLTSGTPMSASERRAATKKEEDAATAEQSKQDASEVIGELRDLYKSLDEGKGITNPAKDGGSNFLRWMRSSRAGRKSGAMMGSENESYRRSIEAIRPHLINIIKSMEGLGAKMFDSNKDMEMWLATVSDPSADYDTVTRALDVFEERYGAAQASLGNPVEQEAEALDSNVLYPGVVIDGWRFKGGANIKENWEQVE